MAVGPSLVVDDVHADYGGGIRALRGVSLVVQPGEIVALIGSNGAGKTTLLHTICGLLRPRSGRIQFANENLGRIPSHAIVGRGIALSPEGRRVFATLTVHENLLLGAYSRHDRAGVRRTLSEVLEYFPRLAERLKQAAGRLSGGEQQMLAIGRALMAAPRLLMLDEASLGLSPTMVRTIFQIVRQINTTGTAILLVEQNARAALRLADRAYVLESGLIVTHGVAADLLVDDQVRAAYFGELTSRTAD